MLDFLNKKINLPDMGEEPILPLPCKCGENPTVAYRTEIPTNKQIRDGAYPIMFARYECPVCGLAPSWGQSYAFGELGMRNNAIVWNRMVNNAADKEN